MRTVSLVLAALAFAMSVVTAAVTFSRAAQPGEYQVVITNLNTGKHAFYRPTWPDQARCDAALANIPAMLAALRDPDPAVKVPDYDGADPRLEEAVFGLAMQMFANSGIVPSLGASCELQADPA